MIDEAVESKLAVLCLLIAPHVRRNGVACEEFVWILERLYGVSDDQRVWCRQMLTDEESIERDAKAIGQAAGGAVGSRECQLKWDFIDWFLNDVAAKERFLEDLGELGHVPQEGGRLFALETIPAFDIIGLQPTFDAAAVQKAFRESIRVIHPDVAMCVGLSRDEVQMAEELAKKVTGARKMIFAFYRGFGVARA